MKTDIQDVRLVNNLSVTNHDLCRDAILGFCDSPLFHDNEHRYEENFFGRRLRPHVVKHLDFSTPIRQGELPIYSVFAANRILFTMNEVDFLMMPPDDIVPEDFQDRYSDTRIAQAYLAMPYLERYLFSFLDEEIVLSDNWSASSVSEYFLSYARNAREINSAPSSQAILGARDPAVAARDWLVQLAPDFLIESSPMARYASGNYGPISSSLFRVIIDELGYGDFQKKHSTLFQKTLASAGLSPEPHKYWQYYLNGSLLLANYYNMITRNRRYIFRYIGAIFLAETGFIRACAIWRDALRAALPSLDLRYFDEHCHIDIDHSRVAFDGLVKPAIDRYGRLAAQEIVRGFEEARFLSEFAENDFVAQIGWKDRAQTNTEIYKKIWPKVRAAHGAGEVRKADLDEPFGELSITHTHDGDELCHVTQGEMEFLNGFQLSTTLRGEDGIIIQHNRLHGALIRSESCQYEIYSIGDVNRWL
ncbi:iron-containing redox enzyme family protein [Methylosinus sporium]|uniref:iron-containing redox enzyme family protein n=1 Tax=Methylosinus sporium TaxID=428 RepID=UPI001330F41D|nr:iron-containing redox enzyme family protein [Methylosinus sporium]